MSERYNKGFKAILKDRLEVPDGKNRSEVINTILEFKTDPEEVENLLNNTCTIYLSGDGKDLLEDYINKIEEKMQFAEKLDSTRTSPYKKNLYESSLLTAEDLVSEFNTALDEEKELETIARKLQDAHLLSEVNHEKKQMKDAGKKLSGVIRRKKKLEKLVEKYENLENHVETHQIVSSLKKRRKVLEIVLNNYVDVSERNTGEVKVHLAEKYADKLQGNASTHVEEIAGFFVCRKQGRDYTPLKLVQTGVGDETSVNSGSKKYEALEELVNSYRKYHYIDFHTHSMGTIEKHGENFAKNWSTQDIENLEDSFEGYIGMLFTPETILIEGTSRETDFRIIDSDGSSEFQQWKEELEDDWSEIAAGYSFENLPDQSKYGG